jgi:hypothetical protein
MDGLGSLITNLGRLSMMDGHYQICGVLAGVMEGGVVETPSAFENPYYRSLLHVASMRESYHYRPINCSIEYIKNWYHFWGPYLYICNLDSVITAF